MFGVFDVGYAGDDATAGALAVEDLRDVEPAQEWIAVAAGVGEYEPGQFWRRELQPILNALAAAPVTLTTLVVDAYVDLGRWRAPGLGRILHERTGLAVIGVAKSAYPETPDNFAVLRGRSRRPLYVTTAGFDLADAQELVGAMAGDGRVPALLKRVDRLSRG